ncbi:MAG: class I SAM-dependent methyltransferase [Thermodesulfobacteriota bacterium]
MPGIDAFEKYPEEYDQWFDTHPELYAAELKVLRRLLPSSSEARGLEVGVGSGKFAVPLGIGNGVDPSEKMAAKARLQGVDVLSGVAENLPFADAGFDFVLMVTTICFVDDIKQSLAEARRVLKSNGFIVVGFVDKDSALGREYSAKKHRSRFYRDATFLSAPEVLNYLETSGFSVAEVLQAIVPGESPDLILDGFGTGSFVAIRATKNKLQTQV